MTIRLPGYLLLTGVFAFVPMQVSSDSLIYDKAFANNASRGQGQGAAHAGSNGGGPGINSGKSANASSNGAASRGALSASLGRFNSLNALAHAAPNSQIAKFAAEYKAAFDAFATPGLTDYPTTEDLAAILAKYANKELTEEAINWINEKVIEPAVLQQASAILAPTPPVDPNVEPTAIVTDTPTLAELLAEQVTLAQEGETDQGLGVGSIY
jgi:hypothetical protein